MQLTTIIGNEEGVLSLVLRLRCWQIIRVVWSMLLRHLFLACSHGLCDRNIECGFTIGRRLPGIKVAELIFFVL